MNTARGALVAGLLPIRVARRGGKGSQVSEGHGSPSHTNALAFSKRFLSLGSSIQAFSWGADNGASVLPALLTKQSNAFTPPYTSSPSPQLARSWTTELGSFQYLQPAEVQWGEPWPRFPSPPGQLSMMGMVIPGCQSSTGPAWPQEWLGSKGRAIRTQVPSRTWSSPGLTKRSRDAGLSCPTPAPRRGVLCPGQSP